MAHFKNYYGGRPVKEKTVDGMIAWLVKKEYPKCTCNSMPSNEFLCTHCTLTPAKLGLMPVRKKVVLLNEHNYNVLSDSATGSVDYCEVCGKKTTELTYDWGVKVCSACFQIGRR